MCFQKYIIHFQLFFPGYANEVGEAFRALVHVNVVRFSYVVASTYVCADAVDKGKKAASVCIMSFKKLNDPYYRNQNKK